MVVSRAMLHPWEEPFISGQMGSGTIFFSGCSLRCVFCQNHSISHRIQGREVTADELVRIMHHLFLAGAHNINLVTGAHFTDLIIPALVKARAMGVHIPFIWNSSGYESVATLKKLEGLIDVYLPDFKFMNPEYALRYAGAADYPAKAKLALAEMYVQGVSTRKVTEITEQLCGTSFSKSTVSQLCMELDLRVKAFAQRRLEGNYPVVMVDALVCKKPTHYLQISQGFVNYANAQTNETHPLG